MQLKWFHKKKKQKKEKRGARIGAACGRSCICPLLSSTCQRSHYGPASELVSAGVSSQGLKSECGKGRGGVEVKSRGQTWEVGPLMARWVWAAAHSYKHSTHRSLFHQGISAASLTAAENPGCASSYHFKNTHLTCQWCVCACVCAAAPERSLWLLFFVVALFTTHAFNPPSQPAEPNPWKIAQAVRGMAAKTDGAKKKWNKNVERARWYEREGGTRW